MLRITILLIILINMNAFIPIKNRLVKTQLNFNLINDSPYKPYQPIVKYNEFDENKKTYTILSSFNKKIR
jgi:hypothetical protein